MAACPTCKRRIFVPRDMLFMSIDGQAQCRACGALARLDQMSRFLVAAVLALFLWMLLLHGNVFFSGYLFIFSTTAIVVGWRLLCAAALPLLTLEPAPDALRYDRRHDLIAVAALFVTAAAIDGLMSYRSDADRRSAAVEAARERAQ